MKSSHKRSHSLGDFQLRFIPLAMTFNRQRSTPIKIYLQKNVQVVGEVSELVNATSPSLKYTFSSETKPIEFRAVSIKNCEYQISLYEITEDGAETWLATSRIDISNFMKEYDEEFKKNDEKLQGDVKDKDFEAIADQWRNLRNNFSRRELESTAKFSSVRMLLQFIVAPYHEYDEFVRLSDLNKARMDSERKMKAMTRSNTQPNLLKNFTLSGSPKKAPKEDSLNVKELAKAEFQKFSSEMNARMNLSNIEEKDESGAGSGIRANGIKTEGLKTQIITVDIDQQLEEQELREMKELPHEAKTSQMDKGIESRQKEQKISDKLQLTPEKGIAIGRQRSLVGPQTSNIPSNLGLLSVGSGSTKNLALGGPGEASESKLKEYALTAFVSVMAILLLVFLMRPMPRVR